MRSILLSFFAFFSFVSLPLFAQSSLYQQYIERYSAMAVDQMRRYGVPASITLAQGLLESGAGTSELAQNAKNHFGIKTGGTWDGPVYYKDDDHRNEKFRKYDSVEQSFEDHSLFLKNRSRYASLFNLSPTDYKGWARGLKAAGYATNPAYANKLISLIEIYQLHQYDNPPILIAERRSDSHSAKQATQGSPKNVSTQMREIRQCNQTYYIQAKASDTFETISRLTGISVRKLQKYNEVGSYYVLTKGEPVFLEKKRKKVDSRLRGKVHIVAEGESMHSISQLYGVRIVSLYKMNKLSSEYVASVGDRLYLE